MVFLIVTILLFAMYFEIQGKLMQGYVRSLKSVAQMRKKNQLLKKSEGVTTNQALYIGLHSTKSLRKFYEQTQLHVMKNNEGTSCL